MSNRLNIPAELASLIEKREQDDRRARDDGRAGNGRRVETGEANATEPGSAERPYSLDAAAAAPPELLERRKDGARREK